MGRYAGQEFENGTVTIAVMQPDAFDIDFAPHSLPIAFQVDDVEAARAELESKGVEFEADTIDSGVCHMAYFRDPDGNALMLHHRYAPRTRGRGTPRRRARRARAPAGDVPGSASAPRRRSRRRTPSTLAAIPRDVVSHRVAEDEMPPSTAAMFEAIVDTAMTWIAPPS